MATFICRAFLNTLSASMNQTSEVWAEEEIYVSCPLPTKEPLCREPRLSRRRCVL